MTMSAMDHFDRPRSSILRSNAAKLLWTSRNARGLALARKTWPNTRPWVRGICRMVFQGVFEHERIDHGIASWWPPLPPDLPGFAPEEVSMAVWYAIIDT